LTANRNHAETHNRMQIIEIVIINLTVLTRQLENTFEHPIPNEETVMHVLLVLVVTVLEMLHTVVFLWKIMVTPVSLSSRSQGPNNSSLACDNVSCVRTRNFCLFPLLTSLYSVINCFHRHFRLQFLNTHIMR
jgi:hypothetical protein